MRCQRPHCWGTMVRDDDDWTCIACGRSTFVPMPEVRVRRVVAQGRTERCRDCGTPVWYSSRRCVPCAQNYARRAG